MAKAYKYGDDVNTDVIFPGKYTYTVSDPKDMAKHALEDLDPEFVSTVKEGDIVVAGKNFGCGSSREQAATCLKESGVSVIVAKSFARIFYRNAINGGIAAVTSSDVDVVEHGDEVRVDIASGTLEDVTKGVTIRFNPVPSFMMSILEDGGLVPHVKKKIARGGGKG